MCLSFSSQGGLPQYMLVYHPPKSRPPGADTPWEQTPPGSKHPPGEQCMLGDMVNKWAVHILLECILVLIFTTYHFNLACEKLYYLTVPSIIQMNTISLN